MILFPVIWVKKKKEELDLDGDFHPNLKKEIKSQTNLESAMSATQHSIIVRDEKCMNNAAEDKEQAQLANIQRIGHAFKIVQYLM